MGNTERKIAFTSAFLILITFGCSSNHRLPHWVLGSWKTEFNGFKITENWSKKDNIYIATTIWDDHGLKNAEAIKLFYKGEQLVYQVNINDKQTNFVCNEYKDDTLVFINNANDYPKRIVYTRPSGNMMKVWVDNFPKDPNTSYFNFEKN